MVNATYNEKLNQTKSAFFSISSKLDSYVLERQIKEYKLGTAIGSVIMERLA